MLQNLHLSLNSNTSTVQIISKSSLFWVLRFYSFSHFFVEVKIGTPKDKFSLQNGDFFQFYDPWRKTESQFLKGKFTFAFAHHQWFWPPTIRRRHQDLSFSPPPPMEMDENDDFVDLHSTVWFRKGRFLGLDLHPLGDSCRFFRKITYLSCPWTHFRTTSTRKYLQNIHCQFIEVKICLFNSALIDLRVFWVNSYELCEQLWLRADTIHLFKKTSSISRQKMINAANLTYYRYYRLLNPNWQSYFKFIFPQSSTNCINQLIFCRCLSMSLQLWAFSDPKSVLGKRNHQDPQSYTSNLWIGNTERQLTIPLH